MTEEATGSWIGSHHWQMERMVAVCGAEQGTVQNGATLAPARRRDGGAVVIATASLTGAGAVSHFGNGVNGWGASQGSW